MDERHAPETRTVHAVERRAEADVMMWKRQGARDATAFLMAAAVALLGGAVLFKAGSALAPMSGGAPGAAQRGIPLLAIVILFGVTGLILVVMAGKELLALRRRPGDRR